MNKEYKMNNIVTVDKNGGIDLKKILEDTDVDINKVKYYSMENGGDGIKLKIFDSNKKQIKIRKLTRRALAEEVKEIMDRCSKSWFPPELKELIDKELNK